jgi:hypothetical protein
MGLQFRRDHSIQNRGVTFCEKDNIDRCPSGAAADIRDGAALLRRFDVQGWDDLHRDRPRRLQRSRRCPESRQVGRGRCAGLHGVGVSGRRPRITGRRTEGCARRCSKDRAGGCTKGRAGGKSDCDDRQHRSDGRHRQVQGRNLLQIEAALGLLLPSRRRRRVLDSIESRGRRVAAVARSFAQERTQSRPHIVQELWLPEFIGMYAVGLHQVGRQSDVVQ